MKQTILLALFLALVPALSHAEKNKTYVLKDDKARAVAGALYRLEEKECEPGKDLDNPFGPTVQSCKIENVFCLANDLKAQLGYHPHEFVSQVRCQKEPAAKQKEDQDWPDLKNNDLSFALVLAIQAAGVKATGPTDGYGPEGFRAAQQYDIESIKCRLSPDLACTIVTAPALE